MPVNYSTSDWSVQGESMTFTFHEKKTLSRPFFPIGDNMFWYMAEPEVDKRASHTNIEFSDGVRLLSYLPSLAYGRPRLESRQMRHACCNLAIVKDLHYFGLDPHSVYSWVRIQCISEISVPESLDFRGVKISVRSSRGWAARYAARGDVKCQ